MIRQICRFQNRQKIEKNRLQKTKEAQNVVFNLKGIGFLYPVLLCQTYSRTI
jgi:hypothetical protein